MTIKLTKSPTIPKEIANPKASNSTMTPPNKNLANKMRS